MASKRSNAGKRDTQVKLGAFGKSDWLDLSEYLVHFTKGSETSDGYQAMMSILASGRLRRGDAPFGLGKSVKALRESQRVVCFSETPLGFLKRLVLRRKSPFGIGFHKRFLLEKGAAPLWYLQRGTPQHAAMMTLIKRAKTPLDPTDPVWNLTPFIDAPGPRPFDNDFRWEREWRLRADLDFHVDDVAFLFIPENRHSDAWAFFHDAERENLGPAYKCPYLDGTWDPERVAAGLEAAKHRITPPALRRHISLSWVDDLITQMK